jgi:3-dehydroquinate dehydratase-2
LYPNAQRAYLRKCGNSTARSHCQERTDDRQSNRIETAAEKIVAPQPESRAPASKRESVSYHVINGPNLNLLGEREPDIYGTDTLADVERSCRALCDSAGVRLDFSQTNSEGLLIDRIQEARRSAGIVINPAGCSYSVPVLDALKACRAPIVEVHISNIHARSEPWRAETITAAAAAGVISGLGTAGYVLALQYLLKRDGGQ